ncbi:methionyl-tRNA transformylase [Scheffersomyces coipomensis]|uniref:methionyl-tRNA transformylase n=1 Tax=Scheffersomyces coipomensis TaxID=1788519 RepID=UPI00315CA425
MILSRAKINILFISATWKRSYSNSNPLKEPLRIAYFGSDDFSVKSLDSLMNYKRNHPSKIESVHVITRDMKPTGRNLKKLSKLPIAEYCSDHGIPLLRVDQKAQIEDLITTQTFSLAIAVSFGLLIPGSFINSCSKGGINIHPSLLPRYAGASPLQYALMNDDPYTGCTIQTLHPKHFDKGEIILQSEEVPILDNDNYVSLQKKMGKVGSEMLIKVIDEDLLSNGSRLPSKYLPSKAPKIVRSANEINWESYTSRNIKRLEDALGSLFTYMFVDITRNKKHIKEFQRVILLDIRQISDHPEYEDLENNGQFKLDDASSSTSRLIAKTCSGFISVGKLKFQACNEESPYVFLSHLIKRTGSNDFQFTSKV